MPIFYLGDKHWYIIGDDDTDIALAYPASEVQTHSIVLNTYNTAEDPHFIMPGERYGNSPLFITNDVIPIVIDRLKEYWVIDDHAEVNWIASWKGQFVERQLGQLSQFTSWSCWFPVPSHIHLKDLQSSQTNIQLPRNRCSCGGPPKQVFIGLVSGYYVDVCSVCGKEK